MGLVGVVYKTSKLTYRAYKGYKRIKRIAKTGEVIYKGSKEMYNSIKNINSSNADPNNISSNNGVMADSPNNVVQYPVTDQNKSWINKNNIMTGIDLITWLI